MIFKFFYDQGLAQASYLIGCPGSGTALVIDPARDITPYLEAARQEKLKITQVTETHIHADFVSGARELAAATGAKLYLSDTGDANWKYGYTDENTVLLTDGSRWDVGNIHVEVIATPGHTPEHICFLITDNKSPVPVGIFTGDCLFVGSVGRPDLLEKAAGVADTAEKGAHQQFQSIQRLKQLPDHLQVWPGHGSGSACGKSLGGIPFSTIGYEKLMNEALQFPDENTFSDWLLADQPEPPFYFAQMKKVNKEGPALLKDLTPVVPMLMERLPELIAENAQIFDTRHGKRFAKGYVKGTVNVPATSKSFATYAGWFVDFTRPLYLIGNADDIEHKVVRQLRSIGVDEIHGYWTDATVEEAIAAHHAQTTPQIDAKTLAAHLDDYFVLDVRSTSEYLEESIPNAHHIHMGYIDKHLDELPKDQPIVVQCQTGVRSQLVASILQNHGFNNVINLTGGIDAWARATAPHMAPGD